MSKLRFGIVGTGWITSEYIHGAIDTGLWELTAVYSRTRERGEEYAKSRRSFIKSPSRRSTPTLKLLPIRRK